MTDKQREAQRLWEGDALRMINADYPMLTAINNHLSNYKQALKKEIEKRLKKYDDDFYDDDFEEFSDEEIHFGTRECQYFLKLIDEVHPL